MVFDFLTGYGSQNAKKNFKTKKKQKTKEFWHYLEIPPDNRPIPVPELDFLRILRRSD